MAASKAHEEFIHAQNECTQTVRGAREQFMRDKRSIWNSFEGKSEAAYEAACKMNDVSFDHGSNFLY